MRVCKQSIDNLDIPAENLAELWMIYHVTHKLDYRTLVEWETEADKSEDYPTYKNFLKFLEMQARVLDAATSYDDQDDQSKSKPQSQSKTVSSHHSHSSGCTCCQEDHYMFACPKFRELQVPQRFTFCKDNKLCLNCLQHGHFTKKCKSKKRCLKCKGKHHTLIHDDSKNSTNPSRDNSRELQNENEESVASHAATVTTKAKNPLVISTLLATARITLADTHGNTIKVRALIDPGSERSFVSKRVLISLSPHIEKVKVSISGVGGTVTSRVNKAATIFVQSQSSKDFEGCISAYVFDKLTRVLPRKEVDYAQWQHIDGLTLADPHFYKPDKVDCLLGADIYASIMLPGLRKGAPGEQLAQQTVFGWVLTGSMFRATLGAHTTINVFHTFEEPSLDTLLTKFWEVQELPKTKHLTEDEIRCEEYFSKTVTRNADGRYVVRLPFVKGKHSFINSRDIAAACFRRTEKRLEKVPIFSLKYKNYIKDYLTQGHMEFVPSSQIRLDSYYIPHLTVARKEDSDEIRLVFNASQKDASKKSLNGILLTGEKHQMDISAIILGWMFFLIVYSCDIKQMFRQIVVHEQDRNWQRVIWRDDETQELIDLRVTTVVQGTACAPFLALRVLKQLAKDERENFPAAAELLEHQVYVDDVFGGADNLDLALEQRNQLIAILQSAGMSLSKWSANTPQLLQDVLEADTDAVDVGLEQVISTLGIQWLPKRDIFIIKFKPTTNDDPWTKRSVLLAIAQLYDPLGWIAPVVTTGKIIMQDLWLSNYEWDQLIDQETLSQWTTFYKSLHELSYIEIPRWIGFPQQEEWHLHGFADASKRMYAASVYAVKPGVATHFLMAKTKLAPTHTQTLPRLELCGAELLVHLAQHVISQLKHPPSTIHFWSDSKVVLDWLQGHPSRWTTYVANRVSTITSLFPEAKWRHVRSVDNAADCATRGLSPKNLADFKLWWHGPDWMIKPQEDWPNTDKKLQDDEEIEASLANEKQEEMDETLTMLEKHSKFRKIQNIMAYCARFKINSRLQKQDRVKNEFSVEEWNTALRYCCAMIQRVYYHKEIQAILEDKPIHKRSNIIKLAPFLDEQGILRVGGRLENAELPFDERHPIILPGTNLIVRSFVREIHFKLMHGGTQSMLSHLFRHYWITQPPRLVRSITKSCIQCTRHAANFGTQRMAPLPASRVRPQRPFEVTGLDYAGPIKTLFSKGRGAKSIKSYIAIFVCFVTKALHIEVVSDLTTAAFLAAYARFTARRGICSKLHSDNATTFNGAATELTQLFTENTEFFREELECQDRMEACVGNK